LRNGNKQFYLTIQNDVLIWDVEVVEQAHQTGVKAMAVAVPTVATA
jgi:hypothetical protein